MVAPLLCQVPWLARLRAAAMLFDHYFKRGVMRIVDLNSEPREKWRPGVLTRMRVSAANGGAQLCLFEQWCEPGHGAPTHLHAVEEVLHVLEGEADVWAGDIHATLKSGQLAIIPAGVKHGFLNIGNS